MKDTQEIYLETGRKLKGAEESQMFGKPCFKVKGKAFVSFFGNCMVFKLSGNEHKEALGLAGSVLFDPSGKKRPMKEWVQVPPPHVEKWPQLARAAFEYVKSQS